MTDCTARETAATTNPFNGGERPRPATRWLAVAGLAVAIGAILVGTAPPRAAEVRRETSPEAFQSGGARSETVLKEISATLKKMDARLERIERAAIEHGKQQR